ncbi:hypothetical protein FRC19_010686 [Serendipita sp. 401]|nr:hypothetical protein FRC19_010686 [Serendipita sp. 401]
MGGGGGGGGGGIRRSVRACVRGRHHHSGRQRAKVERKKNLGVFLNMFLLMILFRRESKKPKATSQKPKAVPVQSSPGTKERWWGDCRDRDRDRGEHKREGAWHEFRRDVEVGRECELGRSEQGGRDWLAGVEEEEDA